MASLVVILAISLVWQVRWERERLAVQAVTPWLMDVDDGRRHQPDQAVEGLLAIQAPQLLKAVQARLACQLRLEDTPPDVLLLRQAMARSPWQAELWATALAIQLQQADDRLPSISRLADGLAGLAPTWQQGQHLRWEALGQRRDPGMADALARLLADGSPLTLHRCRLATRAIGHHAWHEHLQAAWSSLSETDRDQLWPWVVEHGSLAFAQAAWSGRDPGPLSPWQATLGSAAPVNSWSDARLVGCAVGLTSAALPLPEGLRAALQQRGDPVAVWADPPRVDAVGYWTDRQARLRPHRFISWGGVGLTRCRAWLAALRGSQDVLTTRPELAGWALTNADAVLRPRLLAYLHRQGVYRLVPQRGIVVETRVWDRPELAPVIRCPQWCMLIINGQPIGWKRGPVPLGTLTEPGWHRVVQVALP